MRCAGTCLEASAQTRRPEGAPQGASLLHRPLKDPGGPLGSTPWQEGCSHIELTPRCLLPSSLPMPAALTVRMVWPSSRCCHVDPIRTGHETCLVLFVGDKDTLARRGQLPRHLEQWQDITDASNGKTDNPVRLHARISFPSGILLIWLSLDDTAQVVKVFCSLYSHASHPGF